MLLLTVPTRSACPKIKKTPVSSCATKAFKHIAQDDPLPISKDAERGIHEPFNSGQRDTALARRGTYISGFNFFWLDLLRSPTPGIPLSRQMVKELRDWMIKECIRLKKAIGVAIGSADFPVDARKGNLLMIAPEEQAHPLEGCI